MPRAPCAFRDLTGPLQASYRIPRFRHDPERYAQIRCLYVEQAQCQMRGHAYHVVCEWHDSTLGHQGWSFYRGSDWLWRELTEWNAFVLAAGFVKTDRSFVLLPSR